jgi:hypothetical protein
MDNKLIGLACLGCASVWFLGGCAKPCEPIAESATAKRLGIVLDGGRVCKEDRSVATIDYPKVKADALPGMYKEKMSAAGWTVESPADKTLFMTHAADTLFVVMGTSKDRSVPFAVVRYCEDEYCRKTLSELAEAMKK